MYENTKTRTLVLETNKADFVAASEYTENNAVDLPQYFGYVCIRHADMFDLMRRLPGNSFKLYLYFFSQKEGTSWKLHRDQVCKTTGLSQQEYRTALAQLVEVGVIDFEAATFTGFKPRTNLDIFRELDAETEEPEREPAEIDPALKEDCDRWLNGLLKRQESED